jgi:hypothetical protein
MDSHIEQQRRMFELWIASRQSDLQRILFTSYTNGRFKDCALQLAWEAWQEAIKQMQARSSDG